MAGYDQYIKIKPSFEKEARDFFLFLQKVGRRYSRPIKINYRYLKRGRFYVSVDGGSGGIDALFQELIINRGLYYYGCTLSNRESVILSVVLPVFRQLIDQRFESSQSRFLRKHILGKYRQNDFIPTNIINKHGYEFEVLFRKWDLGAMSNKDYIIELDALLTHFLLNKLGHSKGNKSLNFNILVKELSKRYIMFSDTKATFHRIHQMRVGALHRLEVPRTTNKLGSLSINLFRYFQYIDEFEESRKYKTIKSGRKRYRRIKYGEERFADSNGKIIDWSDTAKERPCGDCGVKEGQLHVDGCDVEQCPKCKEPLLGCYHK
jgi:hypothetical protein